MTATASEPASPPRSRLPGLGSLARAEDWLLAGWVVVASPLLSRIAPGAGPFDSGQPLEGVLRLAAVLAALACVAARMPAGSGPGRRSIADSAAVGPFSGAVLLVGLSGGTALGLPSWAGTLYMLVAAILVIVVRLALPPLPFPARRALVTPFVLVSGGLFASVLDGVRSAGLTAAAIPRTQLDPGTWLPVLGFFVAFSGVYYAMLVYAPRQVAEREGGPVAWLARYALFVAATLLGVGWVGQLGV